MRKMKDSGIEWIGEIPESWDVSKLLYFLRCPICDGPHETPDVLTEGIPFISVDSLNESEHIDFSIVKKFISEEQYLEYKKKANLEQGDVLFTKAATIGKTAIVGDERFMVWSPIAIIKPSKDKLFNKYLYHLLNCQVLINEIILNGSYNTQINVGMREIESARIPIASLEEQSRIADYLDKKCAEIDSIISAKEKTNELLKERRQSIIYEAVTKGLDPTVPMKDSGFEWIGTIPSTWEIRKLRFLGSCSNGISKASEFFGSGSPFVSYGDVYKNMELPREVSGLIETTAEEQQLYSVEEGDVFFTRTSETIEEVAISSTCMQTIENATFAGFLIRFRPNTELLTKEFSKYYFRSEMHRFFFVKEMNLVTRASLSQDLLKKLPVLLPPVEEQKRIASYLDNECSNIDELIATNESTIEKLKEYRQSVIYEAVTGKVEI